MSGQYPGQFGPPPGGPPAGGIPGAVPPPYGRTLVARPAGPGRPAGPYGVAGRVLVVLAPLLTVGLLGMVPSLLLAVRRRRAYDILGAVVYAGLFLTFFICIGVAGSFGKGEAPVADAVGTTMMVLMWFTPPVHFLLMDRQVVWSAGRPAAPAGVVGHPQPAGYGYPSAQSSTHPYGAAQPYPNPAAQPYGTPQPYTPAPTYGAAQPYGTPAPSSYPAPAPAPAPYAQPGQAAQPPYQSHPPTGAVGQGASGAGPATSDELRELGELLRRQAREDRP
ncbi:hypothetical protein SAMN05216371_3442 [Streptomyces sp. TLI_053]|uniref:hypothetical protein n=1 Tax=Streptomyces sp. TLI_053 TaxID=1855352 RepID=UPI00087BA40B|nr:hypothetical protein [Streptomyces sp. TLI_053]SDT65651.1 hypothetical protein SAMN05216371_3442 [Streptomyces sp. TLI_053]